MPTKDKDTDTKTPGTVALSAEQQLDLDRNLIGDVKEGDALAMREHIADGANVNYQDPRNGFAPLHYAAAYSAKSCVVALIYSGKCDYLLREHKGRYPSEVAHELGDDPRIANVLAKKEANQAFRTGVQAWPKPPLKNS